MIQTKQKPKKKPLEKISFNKIKIDDRLISEVNIGMVGHVDHGKTTLTEALTGKWTDTHSEELKRGITIKLGYADATFYFCKKCKTSGNTPKCIKCFGDCEVNRTVSFVDAPGHETLMATVLSAASLMDGALLLVDAKEGIQPQTAEHLTALDISGIEKIIVVQNKIDLVSPQEAKENYKIIKEFLKGTIAEKAPIIPISAQHRVNIDVLIDTINEVIKKPERDPKKPPKMLIARSFDINKPSEEISKLKGGVLGGSLVQGEFSVGDEIEIVPGLDLKGGYEPIKTKILSLQKSGQDLDKAGPGGLLAVQTGIDPYLSKADKLSGHVCGLVGKVPKKLKEITLKVNLLKKVIGLKEESHVDPIKTGESLMITVGTARTVGVVESLGKEVKIDLKIPVAGDKGDRVAISRQVAGRWRLIGWGEIA